ncbi:MAG TPA: recombinase family protein [Rhizomicrobium sp.]|jgi:DNA invertase Pin-like site-specific DNA recombinase
MSALRKKQITATREQRANSLPKKGPFLSLVPSTAIVIGYARVSTEDQNLDVQITALKAAGCQKIYVEKISALNAKRPQFKLMMKFAERGDTILFHSLSRMGRDVSQILGILRELNTEGVTWRSLTEPHLDNTTAAGRLMINITGAMAQHERDQIVERTTRGMAECRRKGMYLGRPELISKADARKMLAMRKKGIGAAVIAKKFGCKTGTVYARTNKLKRKAKS